ncbi:MAG: hypothetical protein QW156_04650 [Candidatus Aenigmatarchaeota archaeon]
MVLFSDRIKEVQGKLERHEALVPDDIQLILQVLAEINEKLKNHQTLSKFEQELCKYLNSGILIITKNPKYEGG